ncbi:hypothetical protein HBI56_102620 [Parastagonospora nodorum]|nr:hypothetical protein HBH54_157050 [Parastagonospora nodorum]KAH3974535.1 hypothetical protein HBH52_130370 [Parastagonospora nodorum]KAH3991384.1 hypothetical protein HBI10_232710 [Parastagonospora nodorum]KAH4021437.1 hypothetical protein HBI13_102680 [Parastagonospora nodorum]KAH4066631.1 hypothetical protein HBH50_141050 [Parastagonospora nodorum]
MPSHSSHLLQPLDVGCFGPLKKAYGGEVNELMRNRINHITKQEFLNIQGGFQGAGLVPFDPERVISVLDVKLRTPSPPLPTNKEPWQSQTRSNTLEFESQSTLIRDKYKREQGSSPTSVLSAIEHNAKRGARYLLYAHGHVVAFCVAAPVASLPCSRCWIDINASWEVAVFLVSFAILAFFALVEFFVQRRGSSQANTLRSSKQTGEPRRLVCP